MNRFAKFGLAAGLALSSLQLARCVVRDRRRFDWREKRVIITGGSRGLGLALARLLASRGARLAICARNEPHLSAAQRELIELGAEVMAMRCDLRDPEQITHFTTRVTQELGGVDVLLNVAGIMQVGPLDSMTVDDFRDLMQVNYWAPLQTTLAVLPTMRAQTWGRIVNVASIGGKVAVPHMLPYTASKFALVGLSNGLRAELMHENIFVTTVCPGTLRTGSPRNVTFKGQHRKEYAWFKIADSLPVLSMDATEAAHAILNACQEGRGEVVVTHPLNLPLRLQYLVPELTAEFTVLMNSLLPKMGGIGTRAMYGYDSESALSESPLTWASQQAEVTFRQT